jgi:non-ribosomal peptide synthase protein (TIGR01720 family)
MIIHHLVIDGITWRILLEDLATGYKQAERGKEIQYPEKSTSYKKWSENIREYARGKLILKEKEYWESIENEKIAPIPIDYTITDSRVKDSATVTLVLNKVETEKLLKQTSRAYHTEINDILLTALGMTIETWTGRDKILINLEGHGREEIISGVNINRTAGWFTTTYPVILEINKKEDIGYTIKSIKEGLRKIPFKGIGYGILKYLVTEENNGFINYKQNPEICFNYLGDFGSDIQNTGLFELSGYSVGNSLSADSKRIFKLYIDGIVTESKLHIVFSYNRNEYSRETIERLKKNYEKNLKEVITHCTAKEETKKTASDYGEIGLSIEDIEEIENKIEQL